MRESASPVKILAERHGIPVFQPATLNQADAREALVAIPLDVLVVAAYGLLLPQSILEWPRHGCLNVHASLLPRWRGAAPIERAIEAGDAMSGITLMQMDAGLDTGPIVATAELAIDSDETAGSLTEKLALAGTSAIGSCLRELEEKGALTNTPQPTDGVSYARKIDASEALVHWTAPASAIERKIRAFDPAPGVYTWLDRERIKLWRADVVPGESSATPGRILAVSPRGIDASCGEDALRILEVQLPGGRRMSAAAFLAGRKVRPDAQFSSVEPPRDHV